VNLLHPVRLAKQLVRRLVKRPGVAVRGPVHPDLDVTGLSRLSLQDAGGSWRFTLASPPLLAGC
jgi:hypothetical protein